MAPNASGSSISYKDTDLDRRQFMAYASVVAGSMAGLAGCLGGGDDDEDDGEGSDLDDVGDDPAPEGEPQYGGTLQVGLSASFDGIDPALITPSSDFFALRLITETLFRTDFDAEIVPELAAGLELERDGLRWVIPLQEDAHFHPPADHTLRAEDVVATYDRIVADETGSPRASQFAVADSWEAIDEKTLAIDFDPDPQVGFQAATAERGGDIMPAEYVEPGVPIDRPIGTGPYMFEEWVEREGMTLTRYDNYWQENDGDQLPYFDEVVIRPVTEPSARLTELQNRDLHLNHQIDLSLLDTYDSDPNINVRISDISIGRNQLEINSSDDVLDERPSPPPILDQGVRNAIDYAINRNQFVDLIYGGAATPNQTYYDPGFPWCDDYSPWPTEADVQSAEELIDEAGYDEPEVVTIVRGNHDREVPMSEIVLDNLSAAGFDVNQQLLEEGVLVDRLVSGQYDIRPGVGEVEADPILFDQGRTMSRNPGDPQHYFGGPDNMSEEVGEIFDEAAIEAEPERRAELYQEGFNMIVDDSAYILCCHNPEISAHINELQNFRKHPGRFETNLEECWFSDPDEFAG